MKRAVLLMLTSLLTSAMAPISARAQGLIGMSVSDLQALMPQGAKPASSTEHGEVLEYRDVSFGDTRWSSVVMRFDGSHHLESLSLRSLSMDFDTLKKRAQDQYDAYMTQELQASLVSGTPVTPMQVRICEEPGAGVVMTLERPKEAV